MYRVPLTIMVALAVTCGVAQAATPPTDGSIPAPASIVRAVTHVPVATLNTVGAGSVLPQVVFPITQLTGPPLDVNGKPDVLTFLDAWCPHCAAESWGLAVALSRFGVLTGLREIDSGTLYHGVPPYPHTKGLSFFGALFTSSLLSFSPVILQSVTKQNLQTPTAAQRAAVAAFDPTGGVPALDVGGAFGFPGVSYVPNVIAGLTWAQIAGALATPTSAVAQHIDGAANLYSAAICDVTNHQPASVCGSPGVKAASARLP